MSKQGPRVPFVALATILFLIVSFNSTPSAPAVPDPAPPPDPKEIALLEELVEWLSGYPADGGGFHLLADEDMAAAIQARPQSFELFRRFNGTEANHKFLQGVPYGDSIYRAARRYRLDSLLLAAVVEAESNFRPQVISSAGAVGLAQVMPDPGQASTLDALRDPETNLDAGARYLRGLLDQYQGNLELALAAYNAGPSRVARYGGVPPFSETRAYVRKVLGIYLDLNRGVWQETGAGAELLSLFPGRRS